MSYLQFQIDPREAAYGRLVSSVLGALRSAVAKRVAGGQAKADIAKEADLSAGHLSRVLNGSVRNITLRTVSDLLWATRHDPRDFAADAYEDLNHNRPMANVGFSNPTRISDRSGRISSVGIVVDLTPAKRVQTTAEPTPCL